MSYELSDKKVLVTGASSGIGAGLAVGLAEAGAVVGLCARRQDRLADVLERCRAQSPKSAMWVVDLSEKAAADRLAAEVVEQLGGVDILVNNAGIPKRRHVSKLDPEAIEQVMNINFLAPARLTLAILPWMLERGSGTIVNVSSIAASLSPPGESAYAASKAALTSFSESMAVDLWDQGIRIMVVYPGVIDTELFLLPDNDPAMIGAVEALPVSDAVAAILSGLRQEALQVFVPEWFKGVISQRAQDVPGFMAGTAAYAREQQASSS